MTDDVLLEQAATITSTFSKLIRSFSVLDDCDPAMDLPLAQLRVCAILQDDPRTMTALSKELGISLSATTQIADRLERSDLVERVFSVDDRRSRSLRLTTRGHEVMRRRREKRTERVMKVLGYLPQEERATVTSALQALLQASLASSPRTPEIVPLVETLVES